MGDGDSMVRVDPEVNDLLNQFRARTGRFMKDLAREAVEEKWKREIGAFPDFYNQAPDGAESEPEPGPENGPEVREMPTERDGAAQTPGFNL